MKKSRVSRFLECRKKLWEHYAASPNTYPSFEALLASGWVELGLKDLSSSKGSFYEMEAEAELTSPEAKRRGWGRANIKAWKRFSHAEGWPTEVCLVSMPPTSRDHDTVRWNRVLMLRGGASSAIWGWDKADRISEGVRLVLLSNEREAVTCHKYYFWDLHPVIVGRLKMQWRRIAKDCWMIQLILEWMRHILILLWTFWTANPCYPVHSHPSTLADGATPGPSICSSLNVWHICSAFKLSVALFEMQLQLGIQFADFRDK